MISTRGKARQVAFQFLYLSDVSRLDTDLEIQMNDYFTHFQIPEDQREFAKLLICGVLENREKLDESLEKLLRNWTLGRMALVDRALLRLAAYEILYLDEVPKAVAIHEALELAKKFGSQESPAFIHGVLDKVLTQ